MIPETRRPWDYRKRLSPMTYFGFQYMPPREQKCIHEAECRLYALEEFQRLIDSDAASRAGAAER